ncbi:hypothetical protein HUJ04_007146 [Dendroctonus ponderosae]|nr:hypothetical protein HUJ04_007146 [Dendroctonus ponderosae]
MNFTDLNVFDSDDDMDDLLLRRQPKEFDDLEFFKRFRLQKGTVHLLISQIEERIKAPTLRNKAISPATKVFLALRFYATGSMLITAGDFTGVSKTSACNIVTQVTDAIARLRPIYVRFPETQAEILSTKQTFYGIARFPYVVGAIDCTHVRIQSPGGNEAERYRNRRSFNVLCATKLIQLCLVEVAIS